MDIGRGAWVGDSVPCSNVGYARSLPSESVSWGRGRREGMREAPERRTRTGSGEGVPMPTPRAESVHRLAARGVTWGSQSTFALHLAPRLAPTNTRRDVLNSLREELKACICSQQGRRSA
ncbi:hypothetical protein PYCCODRAFT_455973 [Trametes coccinea BRFM310]|uniref:Uncharacterized protein n=1 Tax=Trametes coccinea (strain BRFM310) TaxID=1353009 RepID=A0A1Y2INT1_TRAC3|nr:hypothetical protein PYCCODRAFT_455973 [Trametes coccinea BRFM310]